MLNELDIIFLPVADPTGPNGEDVSVMDFVLTHKTDPSALEYLLKVRPSAGRELTAFWLGYKSATGDPGWDWSQSLSLIRVMEKLGCKFSGTTLLPWED